MNQIIRDLSDDVLIQTNEGTFGAAEACSKVGTGDPAFATRRVYQRLNGSIYATGPKEENAPGYMRRIGHLSPTARREGIAAEKIRVAAQAKSNATAASHREDLARGWDGYRFVGIEAGEAKLAELKS